MISTRWIQAEARLSWPELPHNDAGVRRGFAVRMFSNITFTLRRSAVDGRLALMHQDRIEIVTDMNGDPVLHVLRFTPSFGSQLITHTLLRAFVPPTMQTMSVKLCTDCPV